LLEILSGDLSQERLEWLAREFETLAQDRSQTLVFFVLQHACQRLAADLEGEAVFIERFQDLVAGVADQIADILRDLHQGNVSVEKLERLVILMYRNLGLYRD
jgi:hypothetical protein